ncbi:DUF1016 N-terminal domain-containing protein [Flavobacterium sp. NG2]|uniref:DUF1016 N-terminal domain-containing protein n=1 Tax=Flavobacterium sp. NG2 TaxID=3097547 RepID=UPI002A811236|nr:DUF1016 N-terminal domain-containing protein [Flavobacterium sp. NG2]WPR70919.1 DUF1016 N-terminal domain-containing protein [Flavobacterium sp. NG2]
MSESLPNNVLFSQVVELLQNARQQVLRTINSTMGYSYFEIGRMIVEEAQNGSERAQYGKQILKGLSKTIGIVLCQNKYVLVEYTFPENNEQILASKYKTVLASKEDLIKLIS